MSSKPERDHQHRATLNEAHKLLQGRLLHKRVANCDEPKKVTELVRHLYSLVPRGTIVKLSGIDGGILGHYKLGLRFPDVVRMVALLLVADEILKARERGTLEEFDYRRPAKKLDGKKVVLDDIDLYKPGRTQTGLSTKKSDEAAVSRPEVAALPSPTKTLPPNIIGAHLIALRGAADAFREMVKFGQVQLRPEDRDQLARIAIALIRLGKLDSEVFVRVLRGEPLLDEDKSVLGVLKAFGQGRKS
ncbi:hypothetical protein HZC53_02990 [Candidatus Uhrbacteria bacterium]|nr:hypothetical protein [Candidatus Uhrbacteria bacterium]